MSMIKMIAPGKFTARDGKEVIIETFDEICASLTGMISGENIVSPSGQKAIFWGVSLHPFKPEKGLVPWYHKEATEGLVYWECDGQVSPEYLKGAGFRSVYLGTLNQTII